MTLTPQQNMTAPQAMAQAERLRATGQLAAAERLYRKILTAAPEFHPAWHGLGLVAFAVGKLPLAASLVARAAGLDSSSALYQRNLGEMMRRMGKLDKSMEATRRAISLNPADMDAHYNLGLALTDSGDHSAAAQNYRRAVEINPSYNLAWNNLGAALEKLGDKAGAEQAYAKAVALRPQHAEAQNNLGACYVEQDKLDEAQRCFEAAIAARPDFVEAQLNLARTLRKQERIGAAIAHYRGALTLQPENTDTLRELAALLQQRERHAEAEHLVRRALRRLPDDAELLTMLGASCQEQGQLDEAEQHCRRALELEPDLAAAFGCLGSVSYKRGRFEEAKQHYLRAIAGSPDVPNIHNNLGFVHQELGQLEESEQSCRRALELRPDFPECRLNLALTLLLRGNFADGWVEYDSRKKIKSNAAACPDVPYPEWRGEPLEGRRLLLVKEQGFGDQIQFIRYAKLLAEQGATVDAVVAPELADALKEAPGVGRVLTLVPMQGYDYWSLMLNVPRWMGTDLSNIPADIPYLHADASRVETWRTRMDSAAQGRRKIGLVWSGRPSHLNDRFRSMKLDDFAVLGEVKNIAWFSLQKGEAEKQIADAPDNFRPEALGSELRDFSDTAAVIENLDMVISVDTSVVHLAGALGKPVWVLLPPNPDWRWMTGRTDSPWYPATMRLFRQERRSDWAPVMEEVAAMLQQEPEYAQ
jgi:tetratricopeptide (TPR) repeat protein